MKVITAIHGNGARSTSELIEEIFFPEFKNDLLSPHDAAELSWKTPELIITTDAHVIEPIFFPGGDIGKLSICGVINDLLTRGGAPKYISLNFVLDEGLPFEELKKVVRSMSHTLAENNIKVVCADTKVIPARGNPGLIIHSTLIGEKINSNFQFFNPAPGDKIYLNKEIAEHGLALLLARENLPFQGSVESDCRALYHQYKSVFEQKINISYMRDCTRGGVATVVHEIAKQFSLSIELFEAKIPLRKEVKTTLQFLGLDPLEVANEGVMLFIASHETNLNELFPELVEIGVIHEKSKFPVLLTTSIGGQRIMTYPDHNQLPRIC